MDCKLVPYGESEKRCIKCGYITWNNEKSDKEIIDDMIAMGYPVPNCRENTTKCECGANTSCQCGPEETNDSIEIDYSKVIKVQPRMVRESFPKEEPTIEEEYLKDELKKYDGIDVVVLNKPEEPKQDWISNNPQCKQIESCYNSLSKKCICPKEEAKQETLDEVAERLFPTNTNDETVNYQNTVRKPNWIQGVKWQQERMYSEQEVKKLIELHSDFIDSKINYDDINCATTAISNPEWNDEEWFEQVKKK